MTGCPQVTAASVNHLDASALPPTAHNVHSGFEMLGKTPFAGPTHEKADQDNVMMKALAAISGDKKGSIETLRSWLRLSLRELGSNLPRSRWV